jgi:hypothetical protein
MVVRLHRASLPAPLGLLASHYWFTVAHGTSCDRWEIWQTAEAGGTCVGHLHCNLKAPEAGVGGGPAKVLREWEGAEALRLKDTLETAARHYPYVQRYAPWPGPNSNTFVAWVLHRAGIDFRLPRNAIGRNFRWQDG